MSELKAPTRKESVSLVLPYFSVTTYLGLLYFSVATYIEVLRASLADALRMTACSYFVIFRINLACVYLGHRQECRCYLQAGHVLGWGWRGGLARERGPDDAAVLVELHAQA